MKITNAILKTVLTSVLLSLSLSAHAVEKVGNVEVREYTDVNEISDLIMGADTFVNFTGRQKIDPNYQFKPCLNRLVNPESKPYVDFDNPAFARARILTGSRITKLTVIDEREFGNIMYLIELTAANGTKTNGLQIECPAPKSKG